MVLTDGLTFQHHREVMSTVADPGFPRGRQPSIWLIFPENCMNMKKFWAGDARDPLLFKLIFSMWLLDLMYMSVADPEFPRRGGASPGGGGANLLFCQHFPKNCI